jgi:hypothetical protein
MKSTFLTILAIIAFFNSFAQNKLPLPEVVKNTTLELWQPGMKLIAVTFSPTPEEQRINYDIIHSICKKPEM